MSVSANLYTVKGQFDREDLLRQYFPLVKRLAHQMMAHLPANVEVDDLIQVGLIGLSEALTRYEPSLGVKFESFASQRIRGAMFDELRENDWMSRGSRKVQKTIEKTLRQLEHQLGRSPLESEIAKELEISLSDYHTLLNKVQGLVLLSLEDLDAEDDQGRNNLTETETSDFQADPADLLLLQRQRESLVEAIKTLNQREQYVLNMLYLEEMNLKEIAEVLSVTVSRVSQLHSQALVRLRVKLRNV